MATNKFKSKYVSHVTFLLKSTALHLLALVLISQVRVTSTTSDLDVSFDSAHFFGWIFFIVSGENLPLVPRNSTSTNPRLHCGAYGRKH